MSDKEIALELTKSYLEHLNARANANNPNHSHFNVEGAGKTYQYFYNLVSKLDNTGK
ncbi:TPA: hypothetical protein P1U96_000573 [Staphylococcus aureus]|uniref:hypothetical protein n=1 Tax=Staphylococcus aureus TaxID=1280 RepID=UPI0004466D0D|nr:hypothetical protein [Staphylococcus aureus]EZY60320.1 hypothetical protein V060_02635 [Staphylococcus aureus R0294]HDN3442239.1 hypothetical protein [Staphylococcus aureus]HDZ8765967.1 hypothetical protein [Staphylococcus aureus]